MEVVFLVNLALNLAVDGETEQEGVLLASGRGRVDLALIEDVGEGADSLGGGAHLLLDRVFEVARQLLDFLNLLLKIASEASEGEDDVLLNVAGLLGLLDGRLVVGANQLQSIVDAGRLEEALWRGHIVGSVAELGE